MNWKTWVPLVLAIVLGVVAAKLVRDAILKRQGTDANAGKFTKVVVTKSDIQPGKGLGADDLTLAQIANDNVPDRSFKTIEEVTGRVAETIMIKGQPVVEAMLAPTGSGSGIAALITPGSRAVTIEVNEFTGLAGLVTPGCRVDVIATINDGGGNGSQVAKTIVQNVVVKAVGQQTAAAGNEPPPPGELFKSVTVMVTPDQAEAIELAAATGRPRLVLRGGRDSSIEQTAGISLTELKTGTRNNAFERALAELQATTKPVAVVEPTTKPTETIAARQPIPQRVIRVIRAGVPTNVTVSVANDASSPGEETFGQTDTADPFKGN